MSELTENAKPEKKKDGIGESLIVVIEAILIAMFIRTFLFQPFVIPSGSMRPTLLVGDYLIVSKFSYGYSRYSLPFAPDLFSGRIWGSEPKRGDVLVFRHRDVYDGKEKDYIKRLIGLPGDRVQMRDGLLYINDVAVPRVKAGVLTDYDITEETRPVDVYRETLPNGVTYNTLDVIPYAVDSIERSPGDNTREFTVPAGHYFMMGDNRDRSEDSRFSVKYVPYENLIGRANLIFFSIGNGASAWQLWRWPTSTRWERLLSWVSTIQYFPPEDK